MAERTGIFGGAFDPVHNGHLSIAGSFLSSNMIHRLLVLPTASPPHKSSVRLTPLHHRLKMLEIAFEGFDGIVISDLEARLPAPSYTLQTIEHLQTESPDNVYYLCIGADSLAGFTSWYKYKDILDKVCILVAERPGYSVDTIPDRILERSVIVEHQPLAVSSTEIRQMEHGSGSGERLSIPEKIHAYITDNGLYKNNWQ
jgi:nicotinate-nucleotide adenylyltransferase